MPLESTAPADLIASPWILGPAVFVVWVGVLLFTRRILMRMLHRVAARTASTWDDVLIRALTTPLTIAIVTSGLLVVGRILPLAPEFDRAFDVLLQAGLVLALVLFADRFSHGALDRMAQRSPAVQGARGLIQAGVRGLLIGIGLLIFLDSIGISITPILASLGVGSLAVALALQETLANLFAGIYMVADKPIEPGHFIRLESGEMGHVTRVGWRSTWIRMLANNVVVVPNAKLAGSVITNYDLPDMQLSIPVEVTVHYASDLARVERVTLEVAGEVMRTVEGGVPDHRPVVRVLALVESGVRLETGLRARDYVAGFEVRHEFLRRLLDRYRREGIVIPFPTRTIDLASGPAPGAREMSGFLGGRT